jgi:hypothetical protein
MGTQLIPEMLVIFNQLTRLTASEDAHSFITSSVLLENLTIVQPLKNFLEFYGTRRFNTVFTRAVHWSLSWAISTAFYGTRRFNAVFTRALHWSLS